MAAQNTFDVLLVDDTSRLSRRLADSADIVDQLKYGGVRVVAVSQGIDSNHEQSDVLLTVHSLVDSLYIKELAKKTHRELEGCALKGLHTGGRTFGYDNTPCATGGVELRVNETEAAIVRRIFQLYAEGSSLKGIAALLNAERIPSPRPRAGRNAGWNFTCIREMLRNEVYTGRLIWNRRKWVKRPGTNKRVPRERPRTEWNIVEREALRIISPELWNAVQTRVETIRTLFAKAGGRSKRTGGNHLLSGFLRCGVCGGPMIIVRAAKFGCSDHYSKGNCTNGAMIREGPLEQRLLAEIQRQVLNPEVVEYVLETLATSTPANDNRKRLTAVESELARLADAVAVTGPTPALLVAIKQREAERQTLSRKPTPAPSDLRGWVQSRLSDIQALLQRDLARARAQLARHSGTLSLMPTDAGYQVSGTWDLLGSGEYIAGGGFEPPTFGL